MKEIEVKILEVDKKRVMDRLKELGARRVFNGVIESIYFDDAKGSLRKKGIVLRLRRKGKQFELSLKKLLSQKQAKVMNEFEISLKDLKTMGQLLNQLGFRSIRYFRKHRMSFAFKENRVEIDSYSGIPPFLEIETRSLPKLKTLVERLGFLPRDAKPWSTFELFKHYRGHR